VHSVQPTFVLVETCNRHIHAGNEVLTAAIMNNIIFWGITSRSPLKFNWRFVERICRLNFIPWWWRRYVPPKCRLTFNRLHSYIRNRHTHTQNTHTHTHNTHTHTHTQHTHT
jgi:hypothetical protein